MRVFLLNRVTIRGWQAPRSRKSVLELAKGPEGPFLRARYRSIGLKTTELLQLEIAKNEGVLVKYVDIETINVDL